MIDAAQLRKVGMLQCTIEEAASFLGVCERTLHRRLREDPECQEAWEDGRRFGRFSLRRTMWKHAQNPNSSGVQMAIHLSKHWLGMSEKSLLEIAGKNGAPLLPGDWTRKLHVLSDEELNVFETLILKVAEAPALEDVKG